MTTPLEAAQKLAADYGVQYKTGSEPQSALAKSVAPEVPPLAELLDTVAAKIRKYVVMAPHQVDAVSLWTAHTHAIDAADTTPYLNPRSPEKRSGKTRLLEVVSFLVPNPLKADNISVAALARSVDRGAVLLLDEIDSLFGKGRASETQEMLRGILNSGYGRSGSFVRMVGQGAGMEPRSFSTFGAKMLSGIGELPGTVNDRAIVLELKRKLQTEEVAKFRYREASEELNPIREMLATWAVSAIDELRRARPDTLEALDDRAEDGWEPLFAIADMAGGDWPRRARRAALALSAGREQDDDSLGVRLLSDIRAAFQQAQTERFQTTELLVLLNKLDESSWGGWHEGGGITSRDLARLLRPYGVKPHTIRIAGQVAKGYEVNDFNDAFPRYLGNLSVTSVTTGYDGTEGQNLPVTKGGGVTDNNGPSIPTLSHVTDVTAKNRGEVEMKVIEDEDVGEV